MLYMSIARLCAEAGARLTTAQKLELIRVLPFGQTTFSKFVQIGTDTRLNAPDIQAPASAALHDVVRRHVADGRGVEAVDRGKSHSSRHETGCNVQKWRNSRQRLASSPKESVERLRQSPVRRLLRRKTLSRAMRFLPP